MTPHRDLVIQVSMHTTPVSADSSSKKLRQCQTILVPDTRRHEIALGRKFQPENVLAIRLVNIEFWRSLALATTFATP
ncbi:hypothetical protein CY34DRAFT_456285 [Suillus luteus UH-Slu-Lm8-n1]|uniref:Uncharacterized protein n=1 Tax=Suillus luteus UH-Slu-Lm8-n1 TaxID=930992 RepID=A0A0D0AWL8_9AGAM|nr:hypothetical protein CY34DRAFT_456285 [Suillus luteus UH-Slu-Lm8-n1]